VNYCAFLLVCVESIHKVEPGVMSICVQPGDLSLGKPGCWYSGWSSDSTADVATFHAALSRSQYHQTWVSYVVCLEALLMLMLLSDMWRLDYSTPGPGICNLIHIPGPGVQVLCCVW